MNTKGQPPKNYKRHIPYTTMRSILVHPHHAYITITLALDPAKRHSKLLTIEGVFDKCLSGRLINPHQFEC